MTAPAQAISAAAGFSAAPQVLADVPVGLALTRARRDLQYAVLMGLDTHRRRQYALSARDEAATVLLAGSASADQLRYARLYFTAAQLFSADDAIPCRFLSA